MKITITQQESDKTMELLRSVVTEERTDHMIDSLLARLKLPWWVPKRLVKKVLDAMLPEAILNTLQDVLEGAVAE